MTLTIKIIWVALTLCHPSTVPERQTWIIKSDGTAELGAKIPAHPQAVCSLSRK